MAVLKEIKSLKTLGADIKAVIFGDVENWHIDFVIFGNHNTLFTSQGKRRNFNRFEAALSVAREITEKVTVNLDPDY